MSSGAGFSTDPHDDGSDSGESKALLQPFNPTGSPSEGTFNAPGINPANKHAGEALEKLFCDNDFQAVLPFFNDGKHPATFTAVVDAVTGDFMGSNPHQVRAATVDIVVLSSQRAVAGSRNKQFLLL